jgi:hypothetical protein
MLIPALVLLGLIPAAIANSKGHNFVSFWIYGSLLFILAFPHALILENSRHEEIKTTDKAAKRCLHCAEIIRPGANVCQSCGISIFKDTGEPRFIAIP